MGGTPYKYWFNTYDIAENANFKDLELWLIVGQVEAHLNLLRVLVIHVDEVQRPEFVLRKVNCLLSARVVLSAVSDERFAELHFVVLGQEISTNRLK